MAIDKKGLGFISTEFWWCVHNLFAHPVYQMLWFLSLFGLVKPVKRLASWVHDITVPTSGEEDS